MKHIPSIVSVMTPFPYSIDIDDTLDRAVEMMQSHHIRHLPVSETGQLVGVISDRDITVVTEPSRGYRSADNLKVRQVCILHGYAVEVSEPLDNVLLHMAQQHIGSALVTKRGKLVGIFTVTDACRCFGEYLRTQFPTGDGNEAA